MLAYSCICLPIIIIGSGLSDVESEINGLITYDRKKMKIIENRIKTANLKLIKSLE